MKSTLPGLLIQINSLINTDTEISSRDPLVEPAWLEHTHAQLDSEEATLELVALRDKALIKPQTHILGP